MVNALAFRLLGRDSDVDDLVQDAFAEALARLHRLREPQAFAAWISTIVVGRASKVIRQRRLLMRLGLGRGSLEVDPDALVSSTAPPDVAVELRALYALVESLPARLRIPLVLRRVEGHSLEEIAELTQTSLATVKRRLSECEQRLETLILSKGKNR